MSVPGNNRRLLLLSLSLLAAFGLLVARAVVVQAQHGAEYRAEASRQHVQVLTLAAKRGVIFDRDGAELAVSERTATIYATPYLVKDPAVVAAKLAPLLGVEETGLLTKLAAGGGYVRLARKVDPAVGDRVRALDLVGVGVQPEDKRVYPRGALAAQVLGFVGTENEGLTGLELQYDKVLTGVEGQRRIVTDPMGRSLDILFDQASREGSPLVLTLDKDIQFEAEQVLADTIKQFGAKKATAVVIDPRNGEVLAMADSPGYDANKFLDAKEVERRNTVVTDLYEPGSTFKMVVTAAALEHGLVDQGHQLAGAREHHRVRPDRSRGPRRRPDARDLTVTQILAQSSNVGAVMLGQKVGKAKPCRHDPPLRVHPDRSASTSRAKPRASCCRRRSGRARPSRNVPIGQGISVDAAADWPPRMRAIANDGVFVQPHLVANPGRQRRTGWSARPWPPQLVGDATETVAGGTGHRRPAGRATRWPARPVRPRRSEKRPGILRRQVHRRPSSGWCRPKPPAS